MSNPERGDPLGRRPARQKALLLSEAAKVARALEVLLKRAEFDTTVCVELIKTLGGHEQSYLQKATDGLSQGDDLRATYLIHCWIIDL